MMPPITQFLACSECFRDRGLCLDAEQIGLEDSTACPNCGSSTGRKLPPSRLARLAYHFFVWGSLHRADYGAAPRIQFNEHQTTNITVPPWLQPDLRLIERALRVGFFRYGPRLWMVGEVEPLKALQEPDHRAPIIERILREYPSLTLETDKTFYRLRKAPRIPSNPAEYDAPPPGSIASGRLDSPMLPVMYASPDLQVCVHECRVAAEDDLYVATLAPTRPLKLLNLSVLLKEEHATEFESLDMAVHMLFLAGEHSYPIARAIAIAAGSSGYDGLVYPSYFSLLRTGTMPFETAYGISYRRFPEVHQYEEAKAISNFAIFGRPVQDGAIVVQCIKQTNTQSCSL